MAGLTEVSYKETFRMKNSEPVNILVVDDMPEKIMTIEATLEELDQNIVKAYSGREALRCFKMRKLRRNRYF